MHLVSYALHKFYRLIQVLMPQETQLSDQRECHHVQEALLLGLCLLRFGVLETRLYDATMARIEGYPQGAGAKHESAQRY